MFTKIKIEGNSVTPEEVEAAIKEVTYTQLGSKMIIAHVILVDGFEVTGVAGVVDLSKYDIEIGGKYALEKAKDRIWQHMGSILQDRLIGTETYMSRLIIEKNELSLKISKLKKALNLELVPETAIPILTEQLEVMEKYLDILNKRIG